MFHDILHDTPIYQLILKEGHEEGLQQGIQQEYQRKLQEQRMIILRVVQTKFPELARLAIEKTDKITNAETLQDMTVELSIASDSDPAREILNAISNTGKN